MDIARLKNSHPFVGYNPIISELSEWKWCTKLVEQERLIVSFSPLANYSGLNWRPAAIYCEGPDEKEWVTLLGTANNASQEVSRAMSTLSENFVSEVWALGSPEFTAQVTKQTHLKKHLSTETAWVNTKVAHCGRNIHRRRKTQELMKHRKKKNLNIIGKKSWNSKAKAIALTQQDTSQERAQSYLFLL